MPRVYREPPPRDLSATGPRGLRTPCGRGEHSGGEPFASGSQTRAASRRVASRRVSHRAGINQKYEMRPAEFPYIYDGGQFNDTHFPVARNSQYFHQKHTYNSRLR